MKYLFELFLYEVTENDKVHVHSFRKGTCKSMGCFLMKEIWKLQKELKGLNEYLKTNVINEIDLA